uniref:Reverse transcriptase domain-containing protein n=1 Tax=Heligmosomoides polygyrus TaxID=6339 RepID=A0A183FNA5_HELPZ
MRKLVYATTFFRHPRNLAMFFKEDVFHLLQTPSLCLKQRDLPSNPPLQIPKNSQATHESNCNQNDLHYGRPEMPQVNPQNHSANSSNETSTTLEAFTSLNPIDEFPRPENPFLCVKLFNPTDRTKEIRTTALLDTGASQTYITNELAEQLHLSAINHQEINMHIFANKDPISVLATEQAIGIYCVDGFDNILHKQDRENIITTKHVRPRLLIGIDYFRDLVYSDDFSISLMPNGYRLLNTRIGQIVADKSFRQEQENRVVFYETSTAANPTDHTQLLDPVGRFWSNKSIGIVDNPNEHDDERCLAEFISSITYDEREQRYSSAKLPFKTTPSKQPSNRDLAFSRLFSSVSNVRMLQRNPTNLEKHHEVFEDQQKKGIIGPVKNEDESPSRVHYLAHRGTNTQEPDTPLMAQRRKKVFQVSTIYFIKEQTFFPTYILRKSVWIPKRRTTVERVINKLCFLCKRLKTRLFKLPDFPTHSTVRVNTPNYSSENTAMDIKTFLQSLRCFTSTNGCPKLIISDSAPTFKAFSSTQMEENLPSEGQFKNENREKKNKNNHHMITRAKVKQQRHQEQSSDSAMITIKKTKTI